MKFFYKTISKNSNKLIIKNRRFDSILNSDTTASNLSYINIKILNSNSNYLFKNGLKTKSIIFVTNYFKHFFDTINSTQNIKNNVESFLYKNELKSALKTNLFLKNINFLMNWYLNYFKFMFNYKTTVSAKTKKIKKTLPNNIQLKLVFLNKTQRNFFFFKWIRFSIKTRNSKNFKLNLFSTLDDIFLNFKESKLYKHKISMYKKILMF